MAQAKAEAPEQSLPQQHRDWKDLKAAYRFFDNPKVTPEAIQSVHRQHVRAACAGHTRVLAIQDASELDYTRHKSVEGLGFVGGGVGRGLLQHSTLAMTTDGHLLGVLHQIWWKRVRTPEGETRRQRQARKTEASLWGDSIRAVGTLGPATRVIHVMDRGGDNFETMQAALETGSGFLIRAKHNRFINHGDERLWPHLQKQPVAGTREIFVPARPARAGRPAQPARVARLEVRYAPVVIPPPTNDPRFREPISAWAVYVVEATPPASVEPISWMLLTSEPIEDVAAANECVDGYTFRWLIEEWHKVEKTGCRLEAAQLQDAEGLKRLAALTAVVAVRLIQLRDLAQETLTPPEANEPASHAGPAALAAFVPAEWIAVVSHLAGCQPDALTPWAFWRAIAREGGFIGRKRDGLPGWQTLWKGWSAVRLLVQGFDIHRAQGLQQSCG